MDISSIGSGNILAQASLHMNSRSNITNFDINALSGDDAALMEAAKKFEGYFIQMMFRAMRDTVNSDNGILPISESQKIFRDMLDEQMSISAAQNGGLGLARQIFNQMTSGRNQIQEALIYNGIYGGTNIKQEESN